MEEWTAGHFVFATAVFWSCLLFELRKILLKNKLPLHLTMTETTQVLHFNVLFLESYKWQEQFIPLGGAKWSAEGWILL